VELAIETRHLTKIFGRRLIAVNDLNLQVPAGAIFGLLGPNGAGKTTTLRLLLGLHRPTAGWAKVFGHRCGVNAVTVRRLIGYLPTNPKLPGHLNPVEYLDLVGQLCGLPSEVRRPRLASLLRAVGLLGATGQKIKTFSTGMITRLGIAASLMGDPPLLLWDEPTAGLDPAARRFTLDLIRQLAQSRTVVVATHILSDIDRIATHVGVVHDGRMIFCGSMKEMKRRLRPGAFRLDFEGPAEALQRLARRVAESEGLSARVDTDGRLLVSFDDGVCPSRPLVRVLEAAESEGLVLQSVQSDRTDTEDVYLQLLQEDEAHGFRRFDFDRSTTADAVPGHFSARRPSSGQ